MTLQRTLSFSLASISLALSPLPTVAHGDPVKSSEMSLVALTGDWVELMRLDIDSLDQATAEMVIHRGVEPRRTGNAATHYFRALLFEPDMEPILDENGEDQMDRVLYAPIDERLDALRNQALFVELATWQEAIQPIRAATTCATSDWHVTTEAGIAALLPELGRLRSCARWHGLLGDEYLANGKPWSALRCYREILALGRDLGESNTLIGALVGIAIESNGLRRIEEATPHLLAAGMEPDRLMRVVRRRYRRGPDLHKALTGERIWIWSTVSPLQHTSLDSGDAVWDAIAKAVSELAQVGMMEGQEAMDGRSLKNEVVDAGFIDRAQADDPNVVMGLIVEELEYYQATLDRYVAILDLDREAREGVMQELDGTLRANAERHPLAGMMMPALGRVGVSVDRLTAHRHVVILGLAAVTVRAETGDWPSLDQIQARWPEIATINASTGQAFEIQVEGSTLTIPWRFDADGSVADSFEVTLQP